MRLHRVDEQAVIRGLTFVSLTHCARMIAEVQNYLYAKQRKESCKTLKADWPRPIRNLKCQR